MTGGGRRSTIGRGGVQGRASRLGAWALSGALVAIVVGGCGTEAPRTLRLIIDTDLSVPTEIDELRVTVAASRTPEGRICEPVTRSFPLRQETDLPLPVSIEIGAEYSSWVIFRVGAFLDGAEIEKLRRETMLSWPTSGIRDVSVNLEAACLRRTCGANEQCVNATCAGIQFPGILDDPSRRDRGVSCDRAAPVSDAGIGETEGTADARDGGPTDAEE